MSNTFQTVESSGKERLLALEKDGKYLFHGSGSKIDTLEPRQAYNSPTPGEMVVDGEPAVFAAELVDVAIFMAIINKFNIPKGVRAGFVTREDGTATFRVTQDTIDQLDNPKGYVYVFDKEKFKKIGKSLEWKSEEQVQPVKVVEVFKKDLPDDIKIENF